MIAYICLCCWVYCKLTFQTHVTIASLCDSSYCHDHGSCYTDDDVEDMQCICEDGYHGRMCQIGNKDFHIYVLNRPCYNSKGKTTICDRIQFKPFRLQSSNSCCLFYLTVTAFLGDDTNTLKGIFMLHHTSYPLFIIINAINTIISFSHLIIIISYYYHILTDINVRNNRNF